MDKKAYFYIDDVIWVFRDIARKKPSSIFENAFMKGLKEAHDKYGLKVQLNIFYRTDFFYGYDEFTLADMPDDYKSEWQASSDWISFGYHSKQEFPDYPFVNADYSDVKNVCDDIKREVERFAGEGIMSKALCGHWGAFSKEGCKALYDCGVRLITPSNGDRIEYNGDPSTLPYGHAARLLQNRKPESSVFERRTLDAAIKYSLCSYNLISRERHDAMVDFEDYDYDEETGLKFKRLSIGPTLNLVPTVEELTEKMEELLDGNFYGCATHEQYFYPDYYAYQPNYMDKIFAMSKILHDRGYKFTLLEEII